MRRRLTIVVGLVLVAMAAVALARVGSAPGAQAAAIATSGSFEISDSDEGQPVFAATGVAPGESARGTVTIEDTGSVPTALTLRSGEPVDTPGLGGGLLSGRLQLTVVDLTGPAAPRTIYKGPLGSMPDQAVGTLEAGEARTFEFTATLPEAGASNFQNAVQGASATVAYSWIAEEATEGGGEKGHAGEAPGGGGNSGGGSPTVPAESGGGQSGGGVAGVADLLDLTVPKIRPASRRGHLVVWIRCDEPCRLSVRGRIRETGAAGHRAAKIRFAKKRVYAAGTQRLLIQIPRGIRRWMRESPGRERLRAKLRIVAVGTDGQRDVVRTTVRLRT